MPAEVASLSCSSKGAGGRVFYPWRQIGDVHAGAHDFSEATRQLLWQGGEHLIMAAHAHEIDAHDIHSLFSLEQDAAAVQAHMGTWL